jgi:hypothetical protein
VQARLSSLLVDGKVAARASGYFALIACRPGIVTPRGIPGIPRAKWPRMDLSALTQHDLLDSDECETVRNSVLTLRNHWSARQVGFDTLGTATYLDAVAQHSIYLQAAQTTNPVLYQFFGWLLERVRQFFEGSLADVAFFDPHYAVPGFHIFTLNGGDRSYDDPAGRAHFDLQWLHAIPGHTPSETLSFTLLIEEPSGGASLAVWHARYQEVVGLGLTATQCASKHPPQIIPYARGRIVVHDGLILHAIGAPSIGAPKGYRITLQGHGVRLPQGWLLYW